MISVDNSIRLWSMNFPTRKHQSIQIPTPLLHWGMPNWSIMRAGYTIFNRLQHVSNESAETSFKGPFVLNTWDMKWYLHMWNILPCLFWSTVFKSKWYLTKCFWIFHTFLKMILDSSVGEQTSLIKWLMKYSKLLTWVSQSWIKPSQNQNSLKITSVGWNIHSNIPPSPTTYNKGSHK